MVASNFLLKLKVLRRYISYRVIFFRHDLFVYKKVSAKNINQLKEESTLNFDETHRQPWNA